MGTVYFYDSHTHAVAVANSSPDSLLYGDYLFYEGELHLGIGLHGPFNTLAQANAFAKSLGQTPQAPIPGASALGTTPQQAASNVASSTAGAIGQLTGFLSKLTTWTLWKRILEIGFGGILLVGGILHLTGSDKTIASIAGTAAKGAVLA